MTVYEIEKETLEFLQDRAGRIGEDLLQLWFDPFFWHSPKMHQIKLGLKKAQEYRGLMNDDVSFIEIRRKGKKRMKYLVKELLGDGQLFPMVSIEKLQLEQTIQNEIGLIELKIGVGCMGRFFMKCSNHFNLANIELLFLDKSKLDMYLLNALILGLRLEHDDFLVRSQSLIHRI